VNVDEMEAASAKTLNMGSESPDRAPKRQLFCTRLIDVQGGSTSVTVVKLWRPERRLRHQFAKT